MHHHLLFRLQTCYSVVLKYVSLNKIPNTSFFSELLDTLTTLSRRTSVECHAYNVCKSIKEVFTKFSLDEILSNIDEENVFISNIMCENKFPECVVAM